MGREWQEGIRVGLDDGGLLAAQSGIYSVLGSAWSNLSPKGALTSYPISPSSLSSGHPVILSCPALQTPFCPRVFALAMSSTGQPCPFVGMVGTRSLSGLSANIVTPENFPTHFIQSGLPLHDH